MDSGDESADFLPLTPLSRTASVRTTETPVSSVLKPLYQESFTDAELVAHIRSIDEASQQHTVTALGEVWQKRDELDASNVFTSFEMGEGSLYDSATYDIYEVGRDGVPKPRQTEQIFLFGGDGDGDNQDSSVWDVLKDINSDGNAVGRMT